MEVRASPLMSSRCFSAGVGKRELTCFEGVISTDMVDVWRELVEIGDAGMTTKDWSVRTRTG